MRKVSWGAVLCHYNGSVQTNIKMRMKAKKKGYKLNQYGLWKNNVLIPANTEKQIYNYLEIKYLKPQKK